MTQWLYLCNDLGIPLDGTKGASEHVRAITRALCSNGAQVSVLAARGRLPEGHPAAQIDHCLGRNARELGDIVRRWLESNDAQSGMASEIAQMSYDAALSDALDQETLSPEADVVVERLSLFSSAGMRFAHKRGIPYLVEMNSPMAQEAANYRDAGLQALAQAIEHKTLQAADYVMTVSSDLRDHAIQTAGLDPDRVVTVPNGVELGLFDQTYDKSLARAEAGVPPNALVFGFVGSLKVWHGVEVLLEAFMHIRRELPTAHLLIVGDGRRLSYYRALVSSSTLDGHVTFFGGTDHPTVARLLAGVDVALAPYLPQSTFYFSPLKLYEYMASGLCIIASRAGQIAEVIDDGHNGLLVASGDCEGLVEAMLRVGHDVGLRARLGDRARKSVANCGWDNTAQQVIDLAGQALRQRCGTRLPEVIHARA